MRILLCSKEIFIVYYRHRTPTPISSMEFSLQTQSHLTERILQFGGFRSKASRLLLRHLGRTKPM